MQVIVRRLGRVEGWTDEFIEAHWQLHVERGGVPIPRADIEARAATLRVIAPLPKLLPPMPEAPP